MSRLSKKVIGVLLITIFSCFTFVLKFSPPTGIFYSNNNETYKFLTCFYASMKPFEVIWVLLFGIIYYFYYNNIFKHKTSKKIRVLSLVLGLVLTGITILGKSLAIDNTLGSIFGTSGQIFKVGIISIGYFFLYYSFGICIFDAKIDVFDLKKNGKISNFMEKKFTWFWCLIVILICWIPIIIIFYPGVASGDTLDMLAQFFGKKSLSWSARDINLVNSDVIINKHHSVLFTIILGCIVILGKMILSYRLGIFFFVIIQVLLLIVTFCWLLNYLKKLEIPLLLRVGILLFYSFCPIVSFYAIAVIKDTMGAVLLLIYNVFLLKIVTNYDVVRSKRFVIMFFLIMLLIMMIKSNGFLIILFSYSCLCLYFFKDKLKFKNIFFVGVITMGVFWCYDGVLLPRFDVTGTNMKEALSIPFMQIARLAYFNDDAISKSDRKVIDKVLNYEYISKNYNPDSADSVKNTFKKESTSDDLKKFFKIYFKYLKKYPKTYLLAFINSTYGYFFPEVGETKGLLEIDYRLNNESSFDLNNLEGFYTEREIIAKILDIEERIPFINLFNHVAVYDWCLIISIIYLILKKQYKYIIPLTSLVYVLLSCLISPLNGSFRYILSIVFCLPLIVCIVYLVIVEENKKNSRKKGENKFLKL